MLRKLVLTGLVISLITLSFSCTKEEGDKEVDSTQSKGQVKLMTLDPGHFHAALVQKTMYEQVAPTVYVYAPKGSDIDDHQKRIEGFNSRSENPTCWQQKVYTGDDFFEKMLAERPGNVVILSGNNRKKTEYIKACIEAGLNVLADKPMCIDGNDFKLLKQAFDIAKKNKVLLYDIMTERHQITSVLQRELVQNKAVFGQLVKGSVDEPAIVTESKHHFFKHVAGNPLKRPAWYFDTTQQGEGLVDVTTHLVDIVMSHCFGGEAIDYKKDIEIKKAKRWPTMITREQFGKVTRLDDFPDFLKEKLNDKGVLPCYANGEMIYTLRGIHIKMTVIWNYQAPEGMKDTLYLAINGSKAKVVVRQGKEQNYRPELYVAPAAGRNPEELAEALKNAIAALQTRYPGVGLERQNNTWHILVPDKYRIGHEAHFRTVTENYLRYLEDGELPHWEVPNMIAKYYTTTKALELAGQ